MIVLRNRSRGIRGRYRWLMRHAPVLITIAPIVLTQIFELELGNPLGLPITELPLIENVILFLPSIAVSLQKQSFSARYSCPLCCPHCSLCVES